MLEAQIEHLPKHETKYQPLDATLLIQSYRHPTSLSDGITPEGAWVPGIISVGNTGLQILLIDHGGKPSQRGISPENPTEYMWEQHFTPEGAVEPSPQNAIKYSLIYAYALNQFLEWWENDHNFNSGELMDIFKGEPRPNKPKYLTGSTNKTMETYRSKLLGADDFTTYPFPSQPSKIHTYFLHLDRLVHDERARSVLNKFSQECKNKNFKVISH